MKKSYNMSKKDEINAISATPMQKAKGEEITVHGAAISERVDEETGEAREVAILITEEYGAMTGISATAIKSLSEIIDYMAEENLETVTVRIKTSTSNAGREFITLELV